MERITRVLVQPMKFGGGTQKCHEKLGENSPGLVRNMNWVKIVKKYPLTPIQGQKGIKITVLLFL